MIKTDEKLMEYAMRYKEAFGEMIPLRMLPQTLENEELYVAIDDCIARNTNDLVEKFCVDTDKNVLY